jgi:ABC-type branched-subunit amino acid transport system substrate-binding protein
MKRMHCCVGVMFSTTGSYSVVARSMLNGALLAFREIVEADQSVALKPVVVIPSGDLARYRALSVELLGSGIRQVVGCYTSSSWKEVIPCFEKFDGLLWYPSHYEGFESSDNVIYTGAAPNQHVLPLVDYLARGSEPVRSASAPSTSGLGKTTASSARR